MRSASRACVMSSVSGLLEKLTVRLRFAALGAAGIAGIGAGVVGRAAQQPVEIGALEAAPAIRAGHGEGNGALQAQLEGGLVEPRLVRQFKPEDRDAPVGNGVLELHQIGAPRFALAGRKRQDREIIEELAAGRRQPRRRAQLDRKQLRQRVEIDRVQRRSARYDRVRRSDRRRRRGSSRPAPAAAAASARGPARRLRRSPPRSSTLCSGFQGSAGRNCSARGAKPLPGARRPAASS